MRIVKRHIVRAKVHRPTHVVIRVLTVFLIAVFLDALAGSPPAKAMVADTANATSVSPPKNCPANTNVYHVLVGGVTSEETLPNGTEQPGVTIVTATYYSATVVLVTAKAAPGTNLSPLIVAAYSWRVSSSPPGYSVTHWVVPSHEQSAEAILADIKIAEIYVCVIPDESGA